jgi:NADH-quinone oxidoreductase subunit E
MKRYDLRHLKENFYGRMQELIESELAEEGVAIFLFEVGDFTPVQKSADLIKELGCELMNSLKFNEVDWTIVVKKPNSARQDEIKANYKALQEETQSEDNAKEE